MRPLCFLPFVFFSALNDYESSKVAGLGRAGAALCPSGPFAFPLVWNCSRQLSVFPAEVEAHVHNP
jgi:hypothetical protein